MKGLILTYLLAFGGAVAGLGQPIAGLAIYIIFSIVRPQVLFGWAGDLNDMSLVVGIALLIGWALKGFGDWKFGRAALPVYCLLAFFVWVLLSALLAPDPLYALGAVRERAKVVLPFLVGITLIQSERWIAALAWVIVLSSGYVGAEMNWAYLNGYNRAQAEGLFGDNNSFAVSMVAAVGPAVFLGLSTRSWWKKGLAFACALLCMHTVLLTFSRGGILALSVTGALVALMMPKRPTYLLALVLTVAIGFRLMGPEVTARFMTSFAAESERDESAESRLQLWGDCLTVMGRYPVFGVGPWHWPRIVSQFGWPAGKEAHSLWFEVGAETGIPALGFILTFYGATAWRAWSLARRSRGTPYEGYGLIVVSGLVGFMIAAQFVSLEGLEVPYYIALIGAASLKVHDDQPELATMPLEPERPPALPVVATQALATPSGDGTSRPRRYFS